MSSKLKELKESVWLSLIPSFFLSYSCSTVFYFICRLCCNLSGGVALIVWFTMNGMCAKNINICMWREQAIIEWSQWSDLGEWPLIMLVNLVNSWLCLLTVTTRVISIVACCKGTKLCTHAARDFRSQHSTPALRPSTATQWIVATGSNDNEEWFVEHQGPFAIAGSLQMHNC